MENKYFPTILYMRGPLYFYFWVMMVFVGNHECSSAPKHDMQ